MATIERDVRLASTAEQAWAALRDFGAAASLFRGVLVDCECSGDERKVTFANGRTITERLITLDDEARRLVYTVLDGVFTQHSAAMQILSDPDGCRFVWTSDFLPDDVKDGVVTLVEAGCAAFRSNVDAA